MGKWYGSVQNRIMEGPGQPAPQVGMGATITSYTDRYAATISRVSPSGKTVWVRRDKAIRTDSNGLSESQEYTYEPNPQAGEEEFRLTKRGWRGYRGYGGGLIIGRREHYRDFSF